MPAPKSKVRKFNLTKQQKLIAICVSAVLVILIAIGVVIWAVNSSGNTSSSENSSSESSLSSASSVKPEDMTYAKGVTIGGIDVSGKTRKEALALLEESQDQLRGTYKVTVTYGEDSMDITEDGTVRYADGTKHRKLLTMLSNYDPEMATDYYRMAALADSLPFSGYARAVAEGAQKQLDFAEYLIHKHKLDAREAHLLRTKTRLGCCQYINPMTDEEPDTTALGPLNAANYAFMRSMGLEDLTCLSLPFELYVLQNRYEYCDLMFHNPVWSNLALSIKVDDDTRIARDEALFGLGRPSLLLQLTWLAKRRYAEIQYPRDSIATSKLIDRRISLMRSPYLSSRLADMKRELENPKAATYALPEGRAAALFDSIVAPYRGKTVIVDFWSTSCGPCVAEIKASQQLRDSIAAMPGVELLFITSDQQTPAKAYADFKAKHLASEESCRIPHDDWQRLMALFKFTGIPHKETVTPSGRIARTQIRRFHHLDGSLREIRRIAASLSGL